MFTLGGVESRVCRALPGLAKSTTQIQFDCPASALPRLLRERDYKYNFDALETRRFRRLRTTGR
jgi:predicted secreted protein